MPTNESAFRARILSLLAGLLIWKVTLSIVLEYPRYWPPDFRSDFLLGRQAYFWGLYSWAFYLHLLSGPPSLLLGTLLVSTFFRTRFPQWHRRMGKIQVAIVLSLLVPSGLWMAGYAHSGTVACVGLALLALATGGCTFAGWRCAVRRQFDAHRRWMWRSLVLLASAVVIRVVGGAATVLKSDASWLYPATTWCAWIGPWMVLELFEYLHARQHLTRSSRQSASSSIAS